MQAKDRPARQLIAAGDPVSARQLGDEWLASRRFGDFESAWRVSDEMLRHRAGTSGAGLPRHYQWVWNGEPLAGKWVLIRC